jgi:hypothetical protein
MPQNHARALREQKPMSPRTKLWLGGGMVAVIAAVVVAILLTTGGPTKLGCINTNLAGAMGAEPLNECGRQARQTCATVKESRHQLGAVGVLIVEKACRSGHLAIG